MLFVPSLSALKLRSKFCLPVLSSSPFPCLLLPTCAVAADSLLLQDLQIPKKNAALFDPNPTCCLVVADTCGRDLVRVSNHAIVHTSDIKNHRCEIGFAIPPRSKPSNRTSDSTGSPSGSSRFATRPAWRTVRARWREIGGVRRVCEQRWVSY